MISKLKKKFIFINMIFVTVILIFAFGAVLVSSFLRVDENSRIAIQTSVDRNNRLDEKNKPVLEIGTHPANDKQPTSFTVFTVRLDENNNIKNLIGDYVEVSDQVLEQIVSTCVESNKDSGILWDMSLRYLKNSNIHGNEIIFYDLSDDISSMFHLVKNCLIVGIGSFLAFLLISVFLANWALKPVEKSWESQRQFIADASHELKTPLTVILANADILSAHKKDTIENQYKWIDYIKAEASHMSSLVNDLLFLAKSDAARENIVLTEVNLSDIMWNCYLPFESLAFEQEKNLDAEIASDILIQGDSGKLKQLIMILLDNACKYTEKNGSIKVKLYTKPEKEKIYLTVNNTGEPISQEHLSHLFERFYRAEESRAREKGGYGLGLSIAKTIVDMHRGKISVTSTKEEGTTFKVSFHITR
ncbi:phospho-acceptor domain-containing protein [Lachnotalea glycerini]|uniref:histidine kinase n=1 Tax=Lachnotalea glycerini TaxID=1763509 RepID=A0A255IP16_9FIRM|nr:HAMP domain-containing sensor histidine kinase [Lachnotalea glycerini]PXV96062.1 phospho-acceptor domain-containing protein [Lachnotalea glycerini]RDY30596.1 GHKL domain-containing protein [Lachnotalea glycerini]